MSTRLAPGRYLELLRSDAARLTDVAARDPDAEVPSCPGWRVSDLVRHLGEVYLHKVECMHRDAAPDPWPPPELASRDPLALFDDGLRTLLADLESRDPADPTHTWFPPDQTVGFWYRRMANETAVHRVDAELASGAVTPIDADLAVDGIDELLGFLAGPWWEDEPSDDGAGHRVRITAGTRSWLVAMERTSVTVEQASSEPGDAEVSGAPHDTVLWLWGRAGDEAVRQDGDPQAVSGFRRRLASETQ